MEPRGGSRRGPSCLVDSVEVSFLSVDADGDRFLAECLISDCPAVSRRVWLPPICAQWRALFTDLPLCEPGYHFHLKICAPWPSHYLPNVWALAADFFPGCMTR